MRMLTLPRAFYYLAGHRLPRLSPKGQEQLRMLSAWHALRRRGLTSSEASQTLEVSRATLYRWSKRVRQEGLKGLENGSRRPKRCRKRCWGAPLVARVQQLRETYPGWGKDPLTVLLGRESRTPSMSTVGRILSYLKQRGYLHEPPRHGTRHRKHYVAGPSCLAADRSPSASRATTRSPRQATWCRSTPWTCDRCPASLSSISRPATPSPAGTSSRSTAKPLPPLPPTSWRACCIACLSQSKPSRSMADQSSGLPSNGPANSAVSSSSSCHPIPQS